MKVVIKDKRSNPRIILIDGRRYILPSNKEIVKNISQSAFAYLKRCSWLEIREYKEDKSSSISPVSDNNQTMEMTKEDKKDEVKGSVVEVINEDPVELVSKEELPKPKEVVVEKQVEESVSEPVVEVKEINYSSFSKKELRSMIEEKGGDPSGMSKANMIDWLKANV